MEPGQYSLNEIEEKLWNGDFPFSGITELGSSEFHFEAPAFHAGVSMHSGHRVREEILAILAVSEEDRYRSEERRVGKECYSPCRSRGSPYQDRKSTRLNSSHYSPSRMPSSA